MEKPAGNIFDYSDFRAYLQAAYTTAKKRNRNFSHRYINAKIGVKSAGWFADVVSRRLGLKPPHVRALADLFGLKPTERDYFRLLVELDQSDTVGEKTEALRRLLAFKGAKPDVVGADRFAFYEKWYHTALREVLLTASLGEDPDALAKTLEPPILPKQAKASLLLLAKLGMIATTPSGILKPKSVNVVKDAAPSRVEWNLIQKAFAQLALEALDRFPREARDFSTLTLGFSPEGLRRAGEEIAGLRKRLLALSLQDSRRNRVFQCNFQVFPLSRNLEDTHAE